MPTSLADLVLWSRSCSPGRPGAREKREREREIEREREGGGRDGREGGREAGEGGRETEERETHSLCPLQF